MIEFRMLGTVNLTAPDGREQGNLLAQTRRLALLAYLAAATPRGPQRRDRLLALFWPELDEEHARAALRQALHVLRGGLGAGALTSHGEDVIVLDPGLVWCDVAAFDAAIAAGHEQEALDLYRGDFLDGFFISGAPDFEQWVASERSRLEAAATAALRALIGKAQANGDLASAGTWARRAARLAPLDEGLLRDLMTLLERLGDRAGALRAFDDLEKRLAADVDSEPEGRTKTLAAAIRARPHAPPSDHPPPATAATTPAAAPGRQRRRPIVPALVIVAAALALLVWTQSRDRRPRLEPRIRSLAVLSLEEPPGDSGAGDSLTEALTTDLGRVQGLRVVSRQSANAFKGKATPPSDVARRLGVDAVVAGSLRISGEEIEADLSLIRSQSGEKIWWGKVHAARRDGRELARLASQALRSALSLSSDEQRARFSPPSSPEAYDLYLRGKIRLRRENEADNSVAIGLLERAVALAPDFAAAQAELANAYGLRVAQFAPGDGDALERAELAAEKALRLDPELAEGHYAAGHLLWGVSSGRFSPERAVPELKRAIALNPNLGDAHHYLGQVLLHIGLLDEGVAELEKAIALDPMSNNPRRRIGIALVYRGRYEEGLRDFRQVPAESNASLWHYDVARALLYLGRSEEAWKLIEEYLRAHPDDKGGVATSTRAIWFAKAGDSARADTDIHDAIAKGKGFIHFHHTAYNIASAHALLGRSAPAVEWLRRAAESGFPCYPYFASDPNLDLIHGDEGYTAFMRDLKAQWERYRAML